MITSNSEPCVPSGVPQSQSSRATSSVKFHVSWFPSPKVQTSKIFFLKGARASNFYQKELTSKIFDVCIGPHLAKQSFYSNLLLQLLCGHIKKIIIKYVWDRFKGKGVVSLNFLLNSLSTLWCTPAQRWIHNIFLLFTPYPSWFNLFSLLFFFF